MYTVKMLSDKEFDALEFKNPRYKTKDALGLADTRTKTAYVRMTGIRPIDTFVTEHEIDELINKYSEHEIDGIRYKKTRDIAGPILQLASNIPNPFQPIARVANAAYQVYSPIKQMQETGFRGSSVGRTATGVLSALPIPGVQPIAQMANLGFTAYDYSKGRASPWDVGTSAIGATPAVMKGANKMFGKADLSKPMMSGVSPQETGYMSTAGAVSPYGRYGNPSNIGGYNPPVTSYGNPSVFSNGISAGLGFGMGSGFSKEDKQAGAPLVADVGGRPIGYNQTIQGATMPQANNLGFTGETGGRLTQTGGQKPSIWNTLFPEQQNNMFMPQGQGTGNLGRQALGMGIAGMGQLLAPKAQQFSPQQSDLFRQVEERIKSGAPNLQLTPEQRTSLTAVYDRELKTARDEIIRRYKMLAPGSDIATDSTLREALVDLESDFAERRANAIAGAQLGLAREQTEQLSELAAMDVYSLARNAQISLEEANQFKQLMSDIGFMVSEGGMKYPTRSIFSLHG